MKHDLPPLGALRAFEAAARLGRMTAAAEELSVSPGAISRQVRQLEQHLGVPLFGGTKARPVLTAAARTLQPVLTQAFVQIADTVQALGSAGQGALDVGCFSTFTVKWLIPRLFDFHSQYPDIEVRLRTTDTAINATREGCDVLITADAAGAHHATALPLFAERLGPVMTPALAARAAFPPSQAVDWAALPVLHTRTRRNAWAMWATSLGITLHFPMAGAEYEHYYFTLEAAVRGLGIAVAPWHLVMNDVQSGRLVAPLGFSLSGYEYQAVRRAGPSHPRIDAFCSWLQAQAQAMALP